jgi:proteasome lid subunit RPN8/RPN11
VVVPADVRAALVAHANAELPNEACGILVLKAGVAVDYLPGINEEPSPYHFKLRPGSPEDLFLEDEGFELALFHSHIFSPPRPSRTDVALSAAWPDRPWVILSLAKNELAAWRIVDGAIEAVPLDSG